jgi:hypothetical protein
MGVIMRYQKLPEYVDAVQIKGDSYLATAPAWFVDYALRGLLCRRDNECGSVIVVITGVGTAWRKEVECKPDDWIVLDRNGALSVYSNNAFVANFTPTDIVVGHVL